MFQFPGFAPYHLYIQRGVTGLLRPSFLIQKSSDRRLFAGFPMLIAGYHVFRRLSMPRHPPYTLSSLTTFIDHRHGESQGLPSTVLGELTFALPTPVFLIHPSGRAGTVPIQNSWLINNGSISPKRCSTTSFSNRIRKNLN